MGMVMAVELMSREMFVGKGRQIEGAALHVNYISFQRYD
jgi:hypothetical protein